MERANIQLPHGIRKLLDPLITILVRVRTSLIYFIFFIGVVFLATAIIMGDGVLAGLFGIFGFTAFVYGALAYVGLRLIGYPKIGGFD